MKENEFPENLCMGDYELNLHILRCELFRSIFVSTYSLFLELTDEQKMLITYGKRWLCLFHPEFITLEIFHNCYG